MNENCRRKILLAPVKPKTSDSVFVLRCHNILFQVHSDIHSRNVYENVRITTSLLCWTLELVRLCCRLTIPGWTLSKWPYREVLCVADTSQGSQVRPCHWCRPADWYEYLMSGWPRLGECYVSSRAPRVSELSSSPWSCLSQLFSIFVFFSSS